MWRKSHFGYQRIFQAEEDRSKPMPAVKWGLPAYRAEPPTPERIIAVIGVTAIAAASF